MSNTTLKRARCSNFFPFKENTLVALTVKHSSVLECKKSDHDVWESKNRAWREIQNEFIAATDSKREIQNLKDKYENLKRKTKKVEGNRKKEIFKTGGGASASCSVAPSATHDALLQVLGVSAVALDNSFDGDKPGEPLMKNISHDDIIVIGSDGFIEADVSHKEYIDVKVESDDENNMDMSIVVNKPELKDSTGPVASMWAKWDPETLKTQKSAELTTPLSTQQNIKKH